MKKNYTIERLFDSFVKNQCSSQNVHILLDHFAADENKVLLKSLIRKELKNFDASFDEFNNDVQAIVGRSYKALKKKINAA